MTRLPFAIALIGLTGCAELDPYLPTVTFDRFEVNDLSFEDIDTDFVFKVNNPNPIDIKLATFEYGLALGGVDLLSGDDPDGLELSASGDSELALPVALVFEDLYDTVQATRGEDFIPYALTGKFGFDTNSDLGVVKLGFAEDGDFTALRTPKIKFGDLRVADLSFTEATVELDLNLDNDHGSNLFFETFDYELSLAGSRVGGGSVDTGFEVGGASDMTISLPLTIDFVDAGYAVYEAISEGSIDVDLAATTNVLTPFEDVSIPLEIDETGAVQVVY